MKYDEFQFANLDIDSVILNELLLDKISLTNCECINLSRKFAYAIYQTINWC